MAWYPGEEGGSAVADVLFGDANPAGRLPVTFYRSVDQLPPFEDYRMEGRTYRYFRGEPTYAFGFGRSFTTFRYGEAAVAPASGDPGTTFQVSVSVENTGTMAGDEVVQLYVARETGGAAAAGAPIRWLAGFRRIALAPGQREAVTFAVDARALSEVRADGKRVVDPGSFAIAVGGGQPTNGGAYASAAEGVTARLEVTGTPRTLD
jgi:beta-glucosidase